MANQVKIGVLGAGIIGLTTAVLLKKKHPDWQITIIADKFEQDTLSDGAAGIFRPGPSFSGPTAEITRQWLIDAYNYYRTIFESPQAAEAGVMEVSGYILSSKFPEVTRNPFLESLLPIYRPATESELKICPGDWKYGAYFTTLVIESRYHLPWLKKKFIELGGQIVQLFCDKLEDLGEHDFQVVVNCTGFGAKSLCQDVKLVPIRGQVFKVKAPWVKMFFYGDYDTYIIPGMEYVTLGGSRHFDSYRETLDQHDSDSIWERCTQLLPNLAKAEIVREWAGLRPHRDPVRVETENLALPHGNKFLQVVHQYGHGGYGVTTAPGTALYAIQLVENLVLSKATSKL